MTPAPGPSAGTGRVRVTSSRRGASRARRRRLATDLDEQTDLGDVYLEGLMRAQARLALTVAGIALAGLVGLPLLFSAVPTTRTLAILGFPFPWLVLGAAVFPAMWALARWFTRQAERIESDFTDTVEKE